MIVVDTKIIGYLYLNSERSTQAELAFLKDPLWAAPLLWRSEFRNVLANYICKKIMGVIEAQQIMEEALQLMFDREYDIPSQKILNLVAASTCSAYDCEFVALAKDLDISLVTVDRQILSEFPEIAVSLEKYVTS